MFAFRGSQNLYYFYFSSLNNHGSVDNFVIGSDEFRFSFQKWAIVLLDKLIFCNFGVVNSLDFLLSIDLNG